MHSEGQSPFTTAKAQTEEGIPTPGGKTNWSGSTVRSILTNEKYKGDVLPQKVVYTVDFLSKKEKANESEVPQYYVKHHDAIIVLTVFEAV